jgi:hypothetical protein
MRPRGHKAGCRCFACDPSSRRNPRRVARQRRPKAAWIGFVKAGRGVLIGGVREYTTHPFVKRESARRVAELIAGDNRSAGRDVADWGVREVKTWLDPLPNPRRRKARGGLYGDRRWRLCGACGQRHGPKRRDCDVGMDELRSSVPPGTYVCDCGRVAKSEADAIAHAEKPEWTDSAGRPRRHDHDLINRPARAGRHARNAGDVRIVYNRLLGGWYIVRGPHQTPIGGRYPTKEAAQAALARPRNPGRRLPRSPTGRPSTARFRALVRYASDLRPRSWGSYAAQYGDWLMGTGPLPRRPADMDSATADRIAAAVARIYDVRDENPRSSPRGGKATLIYPDGRLVGTWYGRHRNGGLYRHRFNHQHASIYGLPDGAIIVRARDGRLWKNFER